MALYKFTPANPNGATYDPNKSAKLIRAGDVLELSDEQAASINKFTPGADDKAACVKFKRR